MELPNTSILRQPVTIPDLALASVKRRVVARIIDLVVHYALSFVVGLAAGIVLVVLALLAGQPADRFTDEVGDGGIAATVLHVLGYTLYFVVCEGLHGATLGKRILGIHVVDENGAPCSLKAAFVRSLAFYVDGLFAGIVGLLAMNSSADNQRLGDRWAHTVVEQTESSGSARPSDWVFLAVLLAALFADGVLVAIGLLWPLLF